MPPQKWPVSPASEADAEAMVNLTTLTLATAATAEANAQYKDIPTFVYPKEREHLTSPEDLFAHRVRTRKRVIATSGIHTYKVVHPSESGRIIGAVMWKDPPSGEGSKGVPPPKAEEGKADESAPSPPPPAAAPESLDPEAMKHVAATMEAVQKEIWGSNGGDGAASPPPYLYLMVFEVDSEFRRRGIATQLMQPLFKQADEEALPIYVEASPLGKMFYKSCGFEVLRDVEFFEGRAMLSPMIRRPGTKS